MRDKGTRRLRATAETREPKSSTSRSRAGRGESSPERRPARDVSTPRVAAFLVDPNPPFSPGEVTPNSPRGGRPAPEASSGAACRPPLRYNAFLRERISNIEPRITSLTTSTLPLSARTLLLPPSYDRNTLPNSPDGPSYPFPPTRPCSGPFRSSSPQSS